MSQTNPANLRGGRHRRLIMSLLLCGIVALSTTIYFPSLSRAAAQALTGAGALDLSFGNGGKVVTDIAQSKDEATGVAIQSDGKIVAVGSSSLNSISDFAVLRYNTNGTLDATFGGGGKVTTDFNNQSDSAAAVAIGRDGKIVVAGRTSLQNQTGVAVARYNQDGSLDSSFHGNGKLVTDFGNLLDSANAVVVEENGKIVVAGQSSNGTTQNVDIAVARFNNDGSFDVTFGNGGKMIVDFNNTDDFALAVAAQPDGKIVVAGNTGNAQNFALVRFNFNGTLDTTFGTGGKVQTSFNGGRGGATSVVLQRDGRIIASGFFQATTTASFALVRYNSDGTVDTTFGSGGGVVTPFFNGQSPVNAVSLQSALQSDGKIIAVGQAGSGSNDFALVRYNRDGSLDQTFGSGGGLTTDFNNLNDVARSVALQKDGKIVVAGFANQTQNNEDFALARYESDLPTTNPIEDATYFVQQQYIDFLNRYPDQDGLNFWLNQITSCGGDVQCIDIKRQNVSAAYFLSIEFQETGFYVIKIQRTAFANVSSDASKRISYDKFKTDARNVGKGVVVGQPNASQLLDQNKTAYAQAIVGDSVFTTKYSTTLSAAAFVDALFATAGVMPGGSERQDAINAFGGGGTAGRAAALRKIAETDSVKNAEFRSAFVLLQYFGYLRRNPTDAPDTDDSGYQFWLNKLNQFGGDYIRSEMVRSFLLSSEYRKRFGVE